MQTTLSPKTRRWLQTHAHSLAGKTVLVTGATGSLGRCACAEMLTLGARLILPVRSRQKGEALVAALRAGQPQAQIELESVDMASFASVDALVKRLCERGEAIDCLVNNAGVFTRVGVQTADGCELHLQTNALSPLRLTRGLLPALLRSPAPRVVTVTSLAAWSAKQSAQDPLTLKSATAAYGRSKLALMRGICELCEQHPDVAFCFAHPGICATDLFHAGAHPTAYSAGLLKLVLPVMRRVFMRPQKAALTTVYAVCADEKQLKMSVPRGLMQVWGYPALRNVWKKAGLLRPLDRRDQR